MVLVSLLDAAGEGLAVGAAPCGVLALEEGFAHLPHELVLFPGGGEDDGATALWRLAVYGRDGELEAVILVAAERVAKFRAQPFRDELDALE